MFKFVNEADFGKGKMLTAFELVNSILQDRQMSVRKSFEYGMQLQSVREGYAKVVGVKRTDGECRIFGEMIGPNEWRSGKAGMTVNEFKTAFLQQKITEQMPVIFIIDGREYKIVIRTAIDNYHKQFRIWIDRDTAGML